MGSNKTTEILVPYAFEALDPPPEPVSLTAAVYEPGGPVVAANLSHAGASGSLPRYRVDGGEPSATVGHTVPIGAGGVVIYGATAIRNLRVVEPDEANNVYVTYYRGGN